MARNPPMLTSTVPTAIAQAPVTIGHVQLRDLIICPRERGVVNYVQHHSIIEHNIQASESTPRTLANLPFTPNTIASLPIYNNTLIAAGGQEAEIHLSLHSPSSSTSASPLWQFEAALPGSINNSVLLTSLSLTKSHESSVEPRVGISNNDCTVKFYDIPIRGESPPKTIKESGTLRLDVPVNHSSLSPDGRTLLSVGDSPKVYLHRLTGGARISFTPITTLTLPPTSPLDYAASSPTASFSTAFSSNGSKFAVASQEGAVVVWDVRSSKPLKVFQTDTSRGGGWSENGNGNASGWLSDDPWDWTRGGSKAPGWGVRSVKFGSGGESGHSGREVMTFTEHTSLLHVVDALTFETEEIVQVPSCSGHRSSPRPSRHQSRSPRHVTATSPVSRASSSTLPSSRASSSTLPSPPLIVLALEDTFRISSSDDTSTTAGVSAGARWRGRRMHYRDAEDFVVIPPLGDRAVENNVQALLGRHGIRARHSDEDAYAYANEGISRVEEDVEMEVDELESDCVSSHTPSRSSSPSPSTNMPVQASPTRFSPGPNNGTAPVVNPARFGIPLARRRRLTDSHWAYGADEDEDVDVDVDVDADEEANEEEAELDLAGTCYDPTGGFIYVATVAGVTEWSVWGAEKRWWVDNAWA